MNKNFKFYLSTWAILFALFQVICFVSPAELAGMNKFGGAFWAGYAFITLAFIGQLAASYFALKAENLQKLFYRLSMITISYSGLILTTVVGALCMAIPGLPNWVGIIICVAILALYAIAVLKADFAAGAVEKIDTKVKAQTFFIKSLTVDAETLMAKAKSDAIKAECKKVYEAVRYSDPMSSDALASAESQITIAFASFSDAVTTDDEAVVKSKAEDLLILIKDRNNKCKLLK